ncbi:hypothetical protein VMUT_1022 [Vulcanisaeta moutnovskia 768-28]|uniref:Uncharacterized protein n=1 Tax=Vulcanisaeta moutnovskia (strain 768-28) TaxID=985053 RepID=F0QXR6_VULM7|nr:hypothetical protein VMUT_1022 [Vulcanisaeta moutnovskia 768-28]
MDKHRCRYEQHGEIPLMLRFRNPTGSKRNISDVYNDVIVEITVLRVLRINNNIHLRIPVPQKVRVRAATLSVSDLDLNNAPFRKELEEYLRSISLRQTVGALRGP